MNTDLSLRQATKQDKAKIKRFYKRQRYSASFMGRDCCFIVEDSQLASTDNIVAAVIISCINTNNEQALLHALVVDKTLRSQGIASGLLNTCLQHHEQVVCFADESLTKLYCQNRFTKLSESEHHHYLTPTIKERFSLYKKKQPSLTAFYYHIGR